MKKVGFILISTRRYGGTMYGAQLMEVLSRLYDVEKHSIGALYLRVRYAKPLEWFFRLLFLRGEKDLWIAQSFFVVAGFSFCRIKGKKLVLIHHLDNSVFPKILRPFFICIERLFYLNLRKVDMVVTVSEYWKQYFLGKNYQNVAKVYVGFNDKEFAVSDEEVREFKRRSGLDEKPIVYIGNCIRAKGVKESFAALQDLDVFLVTSGERRVKIPALNFNLSYRDYLRLLRSSSVVVTMSTFQEGWCLTAHEAMLLKTPVIGSGRGGMRELLEGGGQIICEDFQSLRSEVVSLLAHPEKRELLGEHGYAFARSFTKERFEKEWIHLIQELTPENP